MKKVTLFITVIYTLCVICGQVVSCTEIDRTQTEKVHQKETEEEANQKGYNFKKQNKMWRAFK